MQKGFSLIEFLMVIVILGTLAVVAVPALIKYHRRVDATTAEKQAQAQSFNQAEVERLKTFNDKLTVPIQNLVFYREPRVPDLCVAYGWVGSANGGPVAFEVNCEKVEGLLINPTPAQESTAPKPTCPPNCGPL